MFVQQVNIGKQAGLSGLWCGWVPAGIDACLLAVAAGHKGFAILSSRNWKKRTSNAE